MVKAVLRSPNAVVGISYYLLQPLGPVMRQSTGFADYDAETYVPHWAIPPPQL